MIGSTRKFLSVFLLTLLTGICFSTSLFADKAEGEKIFQANCTACHKLGTVLVGPDLTGVKSRWKDEKKLIAFVHNSQDVVKTDAYAKALFGKYNVIMPPQNLTDAQISSVLEYVNAGGGGGGGETAGGGGATGGGATAGGGAGTVAEAPASSGGFLGMSTGFAALILVLLVIILLGIVSSLRKAVRATKPKSEEVVAHEPHIRSGLALKWHYIRSTINPIFVVLAIILIIVGFTLVDWYGRAQDLGAQVGYSPEQPIRFNHKIHAGQYGIQCQYCHTGVEKGKQANIPSINICMNCHNMIKSGPQYGTEEIAKVVKAYETNTPVRWVRIHNLPDHVYFNHSQHVVAGKVKCEQCHGRVQEMERVEQVATLEMGWCVNCHREAKVNSDNPYYTATFDFVKKHKQYTVAQMGGLECAKCHY